MKIRENEEEISRLRNYLSDYSKKEAQLINEKCALEKRIAYMRSAFDKQQQDLVAAASEALSYRQDIIEENVRLTYALQAAHQERSTFLSSLLPLLSEHGLHPTVLDAHSIVSNLRVLFKHLQENLSISEEKLKESQYRVTQWKPEFSIAAALPPQSPNPFGKALSKVGLDVVPATYHIQSPSSSSVQARGDGDLLGNESQHIGPSQVLRGNLGPDKSVRFSPSAGSNEIPPETSTQATFGGSGKVNFNLDSTDQGPSFKDLVNSNELDGSEEPSSQNIVDSPANWVPGSSQNLSSVLDEPNPSSHFLPTVLEEPEEDTLPAVDGLRISGEAYPGKELKASGYMINGTTSCNFTWVRYLENGSVNYIEGAKQPSYLVTADDVDCLLAIEVQPLDERKREGELVSAFANDQRKIKADPEMNAEIQKTFSVGHVSYEVQLSVKFIDLWEGAILAIKREGYSIKCHGNRGVVLTEKFQEATSITIPYGYPDEFSIRCSSGEDYHLRTVGNGLSRDTIVLTFKLFKMMALERRRKKRGIFFK